MGTIAGWWDGEVIFEYSIVGTPGIVFRNLDLETWMEGDPTQDCSLRGAVSIRWWSTDEKQ